MPPACASRAPGGARLRCAGRRPRLHRAAATPRATGTDAPPDGAAPEAPKEGSLAARMAAAKSYKAKQQAAGQASIVQAARTAESNTGLRPEMETYKRENREMQVEFVTKDKTYKPKSTSWGVFERPEDISAAYGGGRNIEPGTELESAEETAARLAKVRASVGDYRKRMGMDIAPEIEARADTLLAEGDLAMAGGRLEAAASAFRAAMAIAPLASQQGGTARLRLAVCLDSQGEQEEARELYTQLGRHPNAEVKKQAARLLWGMTEATAFMKADSFSYDAGIRETYGIYLESQVNKWDVYLSERDAADAAALQRAAWAAAFALLALPAGLLFALRSAAEAHRVVIAG